MKPTGKPMTMRSLRIPDDLWEAAQQLADQQGMYLSELVRDAIQAYVKDNTKDES